MQGVLRFWACLALAALLPTGAGAAPFCAVTPTGKKCLYYDVALCRQAAGDSARCVVNADELNIAEQDKGIRYCVASSMGVQCIYHDFSSCTHAAVKARGLCIDTQAKPLLNAEDSQGSGRHP